MDFPPFGKKSILLVRDYLHGSTHIFHFHALRPDQSWNSIRSNQVDLEFPITKYMNMGRLVIVCEDDNAQSMFSVYCDHVGK